MVSAQTPSSGARGQTPAPGPRAQIPSSGRKAWTPPKTEWGDPDLQGIWNYATLTPVERPANFANKAVLTEEESIAYQQQYVQRRRRNHTPTPWRHAVGPGPRRLVNQRTAVV